MTDTTKIILDFMDCWERYDLDGALSRVTDDISFLPDLVVSGPVVGKEEVGNLWGYYMEHMQDYKFEAINVFGNEHIVCLERVEYLKSPEGDDYAIPITGIYELDDSGKIKAWRDYGDSTTMPGESSLLPE